MPNSTRTSSASPVAKNAALCGGVLGVVLAAVVASGALAQSSNSHVSGPVTPVQAVSQAQLSTYSVLNSPAITAIPSGVAGLVADPTAAQEFAPNASLARAITPPNGDSTHPFVLIPGNNSMCLYGGAGATCETLDRAAKGGLWSMQPVASGKPPFAQGSATFVGAAPDGISSVTATTDGGATLTVPVGNNVWTLTDTGVTGLQFHTSTDHAFVVDLKTGVVQG